MGTRLRRVEEALRRAIADQLLFGNFRDPRLQGKAGMIGITGVRVTADFAQARVFIDLQGCTDKQAQRVLDGLASAAGSIRREVGKKVPLRRLPELLFERDTSIDRGLAIERVLAEIRDEDPQPSEE